MPSSKEDNMYGEDPLAGIPKEERDTRMSFRRRYARAQGVLLKTQHKLLQTQDLLARELIKLDKAKRRREAYDDRVGKPCRDGMPDDRRKRQYLFKEFGTVVSVREAAVSLGVHVTRIHAWINSGELVRIKCGGRVYIPTSYLDDLMEDDLPDYLKLEEEKDENDG